VVLEEVQQVLVHLVVVELVEMALQLQQLSLVLCQDVTVLQVLLQEDGFLVVVEQDQPQPL
jgi:hypothetical protein